MSFHEKVDAIRIKRLLHIAFGVKDLHRQAEYYLGFCGLKTVEETARHLYLRAMESHPQVLELMGDERAFIMSLSRSQMIRNSIGPRRS